MEEGKLIQSRSQSLFALSCFLFFLLDTTNTEYDDYFKSRGLRPCRGLGRFRENLTPSGFVPLLVRLETEQELKSKIVCLSDFYSQKENRNEDVIVTDEGVFLTLHPGDQVKFVESAFFPPMSAEPGFKSLKSFFLSRVLTFFHSIDPSLLSLYFPSNELNKLVEEIEIEEKRFEDRQSAGRQNREDRHPRQNSQGRDGQIQPRSQPVNHSVLDELPPL